MKITDDTLPEYNYSIITQLNIRLQDQSKVVDHLLDRESCLWGCQTKFVNLGLEKKKRAI